MFVREMYNMQVWSGLEFPVSVWKKNAFFIFWYPIAEQEVFACYQAHSMGLQKWHC